MSTSDTHVPLQPLGIGVRQDAEIEQAERRARLAQQVAAVRRRSKRVRTLRFWFPALIIILGGLNVGWIVVSTVISSLNVYNAATRESRLINPRYSGAGKDGDRYIISGLEAVQRGANSNNVTLRAPNIEITGSDSDHPTRISAANGVADLNTRRMLLQGHVVMQAGGSDFVMTTEQATIDFTNSTISGDKHVEGNGSVGHIVGESFTLGAGGVLDMKGKGDNKVWTTINAR